MLRSSSAGGIRRTPQEVAFTAYVMKSSFFLKLVRQSRRRDTQLALNLDYDHPIPDGRPVAPAKSANGAPLRVPRTYPRTWRSCQSREVRSRDHCVRPAAHRSDGQQSSAQKLASPGTMVPVAKSQRIAPARTPIVRLVRPFHEFASRETSSGILLLVCTVVALVWANSPWAQYYAALWHTPLTVSLSTFELSHELHFWVNDALMAVFFFVVGLEIKRELRAGELASRRQAALPILAALGGVIVPAVFYTILNVKGAGARGWGIPMATDIAFAIGVLALLGDRIPIGLKVFLMALAIVDDIAAVLVIAVFHTTGLAWDALGVAAICFLLALGANRVGVRHPLPYALIGAVLWMTILQSGIHATIAGVLLAFIIPSRTAINQREFLGHGRAVLDHFEKAAATEPFDILSDIEQQVAVEALEDACEKVQPPLHRLEQSLHPWVTFVIMPLFALANAGVSLSSHLGKIVTEPVTLGVVLGLVFGKPIGVTLASWLAVRSGLATLPVNVSWKHIHGAGWLAGIGFTMSLFMTGLAFKDDEQLTAAKLGILLASLCAGIVGSMILVRIPENRRVSPNGGVKPVSQGDH
jgi:NhaA family Na+:H+ antiporter